MADFTGKKSSCEALQLSKLKNFQIHRLGQRYPNIPIYEFAGKSNIEAVDDFGRWFDLYLSNNQNLNTEFDCYCFDDNGLSDDNEESGGGVQFKKGDKRKRIKFSFAFIESLPAQHLPVINGNAPMQQANNEMQKEDIQKMISEAVSAALAKKENDDLRERIDELESELDDVISGNLGNNQQGNFFATPQFLQFASMISGKPIPVMNSNMPAATTQAINGAGTDAPKASSEKIKNINEALKRIAKFNPDIDSDLLKLADMAEKQNATFVMVINQLRGMNF